MTERQEPWPWEGRRKQGRSMEAYYYGFRNTRVPEIDAILEAVAYAGKCYHHTDQWDDEHMDDDSSVADLIQQAADEAARAWRERGDRS